MDLLASLLQITFIFLLFRTILTVIGGISLSKRLKESRRNSGTESVYDISDNEQATDAAPRHSAITIEMVRDDIYGRYVARNKAYIIHSDDEDHYFCSWECRQKYLGQE